MSACSVGDERLRKSRRSNPSSIVETTGPAARASGSDRRWTAAPVMTGQWGAISASAPARSACRGRSRRAGMPGAPWPRREGRKSVDCTLETRVRPAVRWPICSSRGGCAGEHRRRWITPVASRDTAASTMDRRRSRRRSGHVHVDPHRHAAVLRSRRLHVVVVAALRGAQQRSATGPLRARCAMRWGCMEAWRSRAWATG